MVPIDFGISLEFVDVMGILCVEVWFRETCPDDLRAVREHLDFMTVLKVIVINGPFNHGKAANGALTAACRGCGRSFINDNLISHHDHHRFSTE